MNITVDLLGRLDTLVLYQPFLEKQNELLNTCVARGTIYVATSGLRTYEEQTALYAKGRTASGGVVTNAPAGYSPHNFGVAIDYCRHIGTDYNGHLNPDYNDSHYAMLGEEAARLGLEWGGAWKSIKDTPHIQLPLRSRSISWVMMRAWYSIGGLENVFRELDSRGPW